MAKLSSFGFKIIALFFSLLYAAAALPGFLWGLTLVDPPLQGSVAVTAHAGCMGLPDNSVLAMEAGVAGGRSQRRRQR